MFLVLVKRLAIAAVSIAVALAVLIWLSLFSSVLAELRGDIVARVLSKHLGGSIKIAGGVELSIDPGLRLAARDISVSGDQENTAPPLEITQISTAIDMRNWFGRRLHLSDVQVEGARFSMMDGSAGSPSQHGMGAIDLSFLNKSDETTRSKWSVEISDNQVRFLDAALLYRNTVNGLDLDCQMSSMALTRDKGSAAWVLKGEGELNKQALTVNGSISMDQSISLAVTSDEMTLKIAGSPAPAGFSDGFTAKVSAEFKKLAPLLDFLRLEKAISGKGSVSATYTASPDKHSLNDLKAQVTLDSGESLALSGDFGELRDLNDASLKMDVRLYPPDSMPPPAQLRRDLKLTGFELAVTAQPDGLPLRHMKIQTNGFTLNTHGKGPPPITVSQVKITPNGLLELGKVDLRIGPPGSYVVVFEGSIGDALRVAELDFAAKITLPLNEFLGPGQRQTPDDLGEIVGIAGTSAIKTEFVMKDEKARMGPVKFEYDGGKIDITGSVDVANHPDILTLKGTADGWNFGTILQELNMKMRGSGILNASLNLSGTHRSIKDFTRTMSGALLVSMQNGRIHTRLVDLAGLGILPWLFSDEHGKVTPITCLRAPMKLDEGKITIDEAAMETSKVQLVASGYVNLRTETLDVTGEPRPIGKPLSRSPWPFVVLGSLKHPKLSLKKGAHRQKRSDGAHAMPKYRKPCIADILQLE